MTKEVLRDFRERRKHFCAGPVEGTLQLLGLEARIEFRSAWMSGGTPEWAED